MKAKWALSNILSNQFLLIKIFRFIFALFMLFTVCCSQNEVPISGDTVLDTFGENDLVVEDTTSDMPLDPADSEIDAEREPDGAFLECPFPDDVRVFISVDPFIEDDSFTSTGQVTAVGKETDGSLLIAVDFSASGLEPSIRAFQLPIPEGVDVDLHPGEEVEVEYSNVMTPWMPSTDLTILKNGEAIVKASKCIHQCMLYSIVFPPLSFSQIARRCEPQPEWEGCALYERLGYSVSCESMVDNMEVFDHGYVRVPCGSGYHIIVGTFDRFVEFITTCTDLPDSREEIIVIKHGDGLAGSSP